MAASTTTVTTRRSSGRGGAPTAAEVRDAIEGMPDTASVRVVSKIGGQRDEYETWEITVTFMGPLPQPVTHMPIYPPGVRAPRPDPYA